jgi:hypothetical protein
MIGCDENIGERTRFPEKNEERNSEGATSPLAEHRQQLIEGAAHERNLP